MMHKSRIGCLVIDCQTDDLAGPLAFWTKALGTSAEVDDDGKYAKLDMPDGSPAVLLQAVEHTSRVHLDVETDDKDAECERLKGLGATEVARIKGWIVMDAPTGHRFCIVGPQGGDFPARTAEWGET